MSVMNGFSATLRKHHNSRPFAAFFSAMGVPLPHTITVAPRMTVILRRRGQTNYQPNPARAIRSCPVESRDRRRAINRSSFVKQNDCSLDGRASDPAGTPALPIRPYTRPVAARCAGEPCATFETKSVAAIPAEAVKNERRVTTLKSMSVMSLKKRKRPRSSAEFSGSDMQTAVRSPHRSCPDAFNLARYGFGEIRCRTTIFSCRETGFGVQRILGHANRGHVRIGTRSD